MNFRDAFLEQAKDFVSNYEIDKSNEKQIGIILNYFAGIDSKETPLTKGLLICGGVGVGKTLTFKIIQKIVRNFAINNIREVVAEFNIGGFEALDRYIKTKDRLFDDLGSELNGRYYGNVVNVVDELILRRYEIFQNNGLLTHFTTNLDTLGLQEKYDERSYDRLKEICTIIILDTPSRRGKVLPIKKEVVEIKLSKEEIDKKNEESALRFIEKIYNSEDIYNVGYEIAYDYLKAKKILLLTQKQRDKISAEAQDQAMKEQVRENDNLISQGKIREARRMFDKPLNTIMLKKKIAVSEFLQDRKDMDIPLKEVLNES